MKFAALLDRVKTNIFCLKYFFIKVSGYHHHHEVVSIDLINLQLGIGNMISMSPAGRISFEWGVENSQKNPQTHSF